MSFRLVIGTNNQKKLKELEYLLSPFGFQLNGLSDVPDPIEVDETGSSFQENAELKASEQAKHLRQWVLAEDSGISVDALDGRPGIYSARFSGEDATDEKNNLLLLEKLDGVPRKKRTAYYTSHIAVADPLGVIHLNCEATCHGIILKEPRGENGFGYDPLFLIAEYHKTFGQLGPTVKSVLSHRARANRQLVPKLLALAQSQTRST